jgi:hypothetical protein
MKKSELTDSGGIGNVFMSVVMFTGILPVFVVVCNLLRGVGSVGNKMSE